MKKLLLATCAVFLTLLTWAQDVIVCKDAKRIDAIITEVSLVEVKYKKQGNPNGPTFVLPFSEISTILYADGEVWTNQEIATLNNNNSNKKTDDNTDPKENLNPKLKFNPTPMGKKHIVGLTLGYTSKNHQGSRDVLGWMDTDRTNTPGLLVGLTITPEFKYGIGIQIGITYEMYRACYAESAEYYYTQNDNYERSIELGRPSSPIMINVSAIEHSFNIPLRLQYRYEIIQDLSVFFYTGPAFEVVLNPTYKCTYDDINMLSEELKEIIENKIETYGQTYDIYGENGPYRRFQMYWGVGGGVQWKNWQLRMSGDWGITDLRKNHRFGSFYTRNKPFSICLSYLF